MTQVTIKAEDYGLEKSKANELTVGLKIVKAERELLIKEFESVSKLELTQKNLPVFKKLRLAIVKNRTQGIDKWHKTNKEFFLTGGKFVDAIKNKERAINEQMEEKLMDAEKHFENLEKERIEKLNNKRIKLVRPYLDEVDNLFLADMEDDVFDAYLLTKKNNHEAIVKADKEREEARLMAIEEEKAEQERIRLENIQLRKEAEEKEKQLSERSEKLRPYIKFIRDYNKMINLPQDEFEKEFIDVDKGAKAHYKYEAEQAEKVKRENEEKLIEEAKQKKITESRIKAAKIIEDKLRAKEDAEIQGKQEEEARLQHELNKGDSDKVRDLIKDLEALKTKYSFKSAKNNKMYSDTGLLIDKVINHVQK